MRRRATRASFNSGRHIDDLSLYRIHAREGNRAAHPV
jgi:hypothetical protein